jgi:hypothetical protein
MARFWIGGLEIGGRDGRYGTEVDDRSLVRRPTVR